MTLTEKIRLNQLYIDEWLKTLSEFDEIKIDDDVEKILNSNEFKELDKILSSNN